MADWNSGWVQVVVTSHLQLAGRWSIWSVGRDLSWAQVRKLTGTIAPLQALTPVRIGWDSRCRKVVDPLKCHLWIRIRWPSGAPRSWPLSTSGLCPTFVNDRAPHSSFHFPNLSTFGNGTVFLWFATASLLLFCKAFDYTLHNGIYSAVKFLHSARCCVRTQAVCIVM